MYPVADVVSSSPNSQRSNQVKELVTPLWSLPASCPGLDCKAPTPKGEVQRTGNSATRKPVSGATTPGFLGPLPPHPSCFKKSSFHRSVFLGRRPFVSHGRFLGRRPFVRSTIARWQEATDPQSPKGGSQRACTHEGCPPHGFWATQNGGVVSAVIPCPHERGRW